MSAKVSSLSFHGFTPATDMDPSPSNQMAKGVNIKLEPPQRLGLNQNPTPSLRYANLYILALSNFFRIR